MQPEKLADASARAVTVPPSVYAGIMERKRTGRNTDSAAEVLQIIDDEFPPGSEQRQRLEAAAADAEWLLREHGYGSLLDDA